MSALLDRVPTLSHRIHTEPAGPAATRPFGLDALTNPVPAAAGPRPVLTVDPVSQLSVMDGRVVLDSPTMNQGTACNTESDGKDAIAVDYDTNDD
ncbi:hypothetical protein AB0953_02660 [Streptomyces sp. NPDC046866]|uniref:hypothetical protein n=1 Tax=Streptomyces sp. NPDC046866 TaxID=3154921 RepID=UPI003451396D